ncbi:MAG: RNA-binding protein [Planctomycetia bacterium]|nr:RNA-binding protein [Planctomycetia bacterium]
MRIYVGNLSYRTTEEGLRGLFENYGAVESVSIINDRETNRSKGFGFVEMPNNDEANKAIENIDNTEFEERTLKVNEARARQSHPSGSGRPQRSGDRPPRRF